MEEDDDEDEEEEETAEQEEEEDQEDEDEDEEGDDEEEENFIAIGSRGILIQSDLERLCCNRTLADFAAIGLWWILQQSYLGGFAAVSP